MEIFFPILRFTPISGSKHLDSIFRNKISKIFITNLGSWEFINYLGGISRGRVEVRDFLLPILVLNGVTSR